MGSFQYNNNTLQYIHTAEGYVRHTPRPTGTSYGAFDYVYNYTDHLGNIRLSYTLDPSDQVLKILEENHYYPFGMKHSYNTSKRDIRTVDAEIDLNGNLVNPTNNLTNFEPSEDIRRVRMVSNTGYQYKYNGKEWQDELGLNVTFMDFRQYDATIGRFNGMDRLAELVPSMSPYRFGFNNPVYWSDPTGLLEQSENLSSLDTDFPSADVSITFERLGGNGLARCDTCPNKPEFKPFIDDPFNDYEYNSETNLVRKITELEGVTVSATQTSQSSNSHPSTYLSPTFLGSGLELSYGFIGSIGEEAFKNGSYKQSNGRTGNYHDRPYNRLSKRAKAYYNFHKSLNYVKHAGTGVTVILGSIEIANGLTADIEIYERTGQTNLKNSAIASGKVVGGAAVGYGVGAGATWLTSALVGAGGGSVAPGVGTAIGFVVGAVAGYYASNEIGNVIESAYE